MQLEKWEGTRAVDGRIQFCLDNTADFVALVSKAEFMDYEHYIWRGQSDSEWSLAPTFDRLMFRSGRPATDATAKAHLRRFKFSARGRRGIAHLRTEEENYWWALGQHHGLATPLLDWTHSPFVALFFALYGTPPHGPSMRSVFALYSPVRKNRELGRTEGGEAKQLKMIRPMQDDNARLLSQAGIFTRAPAGMRVEDWVQEHHKGERGTYLVKLDIPSSEREPGLALLNRMNINHLSLFPDLYGAAEYCNASLMLPHYGM